MTLLERLGPQLAEALAAMLVRCATHGPTPWVVTCQCVLEGALAAEATTTAVLCDDHVNLAENGDPAADEDLVPSCIACLADRGLLKGA